MDSSPSDRRLLTVAEIAQADKDAAAGGTPTAVLMERAGAAVFDAIVARWSPRPAVVLCGPGNNGGDGYVVALRLAEARWPVRVASDPAAGPRRGAAGAMAALWTGATLGLDAQALDGAGLVVDALFGAGLSRPIPPAASAALRAAEAAGLPLIAVDLPSGLAGDTGAPIGYAPQATLTVSFHLKKPAHVLEPGRGLCGEIVIADIGLPAPEATPAGLYENGPELWLDRYPWPKTQTYKSKRGHLMVVSGPAWSTGAARLSARAGLRIGAGLVTLLSPPDALAVNAAHLEAVMLRPFNSDTALHQAVEHADVAVIGPGAGAGPQTRLNVLALARTGKALVLDADVFTVFRDAPDELFAHLDADDVLTPHPGEFERIFPGLLAAGPERITAARRAAARARAVVVLKGADTVVAAPDGRAVVSTNASPWLATAGSGDVLSGFIAGLIAQGMESFDAACAGVWIHAEAGRTFGPGLTAEDIPDRAPRILRALDRYGDRLSGRSR